MLYEWLKIVHVISAAILFGTGMGTAFYMFYVNFSQDIDLIANATKQVVFADWVFTGSAGVLQAITGFSMIALKGYSLKLPWIYGSIIGYLIAGACWLPVVWLQIRCAQLASNAAASQQPLPKRYHTYFRMWWLLGIPAFLALVGVYYLMTNKVV
ncbi:MAG: hypothetical protein COB66_09550 [Coxiella sp. (in: Bacteria)]|nr:MAG: hypothetical protein COB66_09550 [Coxiella sp. (in: g-proteobacteria)]